MKISVSVTDSPLFTDLEYMFAGLKKTGVDGIELVPGFKSRWNLAKVKRLSEKYHLPVLSFHQPPWSVLGWWFDEAFITEARKMGLRQITFHPPAQYTFADEQMKQFLQRLAQVQKKL